MVTRAKIKTIDRGYKDLMAQVAKIAGKSHAAIGVRGDEAKELKKDEDGNTDGVTTLVQIASVHEFGSQDGTIPERAPIKKTVIREENNYKKLMRRLAKDILDPKALMDYKKALGIAGEKVLMDMQRTIRESIEIQPVTEETQRRKGPDKTTPLIDTGQLIQGLSYEVRIRK